MNFKELLEGAEPKMPGAPSGIKIMTPQQFVASAGDEKSDKEVSEGPDEVIGLANFAAGGGILGGQNPADIVFEFAPYDHNDSDDDFDGEEDDEELRSLYDTKAELEAELDYADEEDREHLESELEDVHARIQQIKPDAILEQGVAEGLEPNREAAKTLQNLKNLALMKSALTSQQLRQAGRESMITDAINACIQFEQSYLQNKQQGNAIFVRALRDEIDNFRKGYPINSSMPEDNAPELGDLLQGKLGKLNFQQGVAEEQLNEFAPLLAAGARLFMAAAPKIAQVVGKAGQAGARGAGQAAKAGTEIAAKNAGQIGIGAGAYEIGSSVADIAKDITAKVGTALDEKTLLDLAALAFKYAIPAGIVLAILYGGKKAIDSLFADPKTQQGVAEGQEHLDRIRKLSGLGEATKLPASSREFGSDEFQDYMKRIVGTPDLDKSGNVKIDKKGNEKYTTGKTKGDKYKMPYIHRSSVVTYLSPDGKTYDEDAVKQTLAIRPKSLLKQNEKMKHSNGEFEQFFNVGFAALVGIALDEQTNKLIVVNTCPGAGSCKVECFAMKGGKIQFKAAWQSDGRILTYLLNDPDGFFNQLSSEISAEAQAAAKGDKKFPNGWQTTVRWHDAGDFFSPEYLDMALKMAAKHPDVKFYAYTKMAGAALAQKPDNFIINWSEGANTTQEKQIKAQDPKLDNTKNSRIVPEKLFYDLLAKDEKGNLEKTADGAWQPAGPQELQQMKQRIATEYGISASSILSYTEYMAKRNSIPAGMKYNVIVAPGEGDVSANDPGVLSTLLLRH